MANFDGKSLAIILLVAFIVYMLFFKKNSCGFTLEGAPIDGSDEVSAPAVATQESAPKQMKMSGSDSDAATSASEAAMAPPAVDVASAALLPNEVPITDDYGQFSTEAILSGQNYLDPRGQIGYPETVGGTLRNANLQIRSEPANPRDPVSIWNLSTITPETMRPLFEIGQDKEYA